MKTLFFFNIIAATLFVATAVADDNVPQFLLTWGKYGSGPGEFSIPLSVTTDAAGRVYVTDANNERIQVFTNDGDFLHTFGSFGSSDGQFETPWDIAIDSQNYIYVTDKANNHVQKFAENGKFVLKWGDWGSGDGQFMNPLGIAIDEDEYVYVVDWGNRRIQKFTNEGGFVLQWGGPTHFFAPRGIDIDGYGNVYVSDGGTIKKYSSEGRFISQWDGHAMWGDLFYGGIAGIAVDKESGKVYVTDVNRDRIQEFSSDGRFLLEWGGVGVGPGQFNAPLGVTIDAYGFIFVVEFVNCRVQKFSSTLTLVQQTSWGRMKQLFR